MKHKMFFQIGVIIIVVAALIYIIMFPLGCRYMYKDDIGKYKGLIPSQYNSLNRIVDPIYILPEQYRYYGRYNYKAWESGKIQTIPIIDDRKVSKCFFECNDQVYYFYYSDAQVDKDSNHGFPFEIAYQDIYNENTDEVELCLWDNPEGHFITDNYLYYVYGNNHYHVKVFTFKFLSEGGFFEYSNKKDYNYARLNLDTFENEKIARSQYEERYNVLYTSIFST